MMISDNTLGGLVRYVEDGIPTGSFLRAVLIGDLFDACGRADDLNRYALFDIVRWLYNVPPAGCKGSKDRVEAWLDMDPEQRANVLARCPSWQEFKQAETAPGVETEDGEPAGNEPERAGAETPATQ